MNLLISILGAVLVIIGLIREILPATEHIGYHIIILPGYFIMLLGFIVIFFSIVFSSKIKTI